jgi:hypothetical protein
LLSNFTKIKVTELKTHTIANCVVLAVSIAAAISTNNSYADVHSSADLIKAQPLAVFQAIRGESLADTLAQVSQRSGINFKINTDLGKDVVSQSITADNWNIAVRSLLVNYNFTIIQDSDTVKTVIISGSNNNDDDYAVADDEANTGIVTTVAGSSDDENAFEPIQSSIMYTDHESCDGDKSPRSGSASSGPI